MRMKMKSVCVFLLILVSLEEVCCLGRWEQEREALLGLKARLGNPTSWVGGTDCCQWEGVECNITTGRVAKLNLHGMRGYWLGNWHLNYSDFLVFEDLKSLDLKSNYIASCVENEGLENRELRFGSLEVLDLSYNSLNITASILSCLDGLSSLKSLYLRSNGLTASSFDAFEKLSSKLLYLEVLDLSDNHLTNDILPSLGGFTSLKKLDLSQTGLDSVLHIQGILKLYSLETLNLAGNDFNDSILWSLGGFQHLKYLYLSHNRLEGSLDVSGLLALSNLEILDLNFNNINNFVVNQDSKSLSRLKVLALDRNKIDGSMLQKSLRAFSSVRMLSLCDNEFKGKVVAEDFRDLVSLEHLALDYSFDLVNEFFKSIGTLTSLKVLSVSCCGINGTLPAADWSNLKKLEELDLSYNEFEGPLPSSFGNMTSLRRLKLSYNHFTGNFGSNIASLTSLKYIGFMKNQFQVPISFTPFANLSNLKFIYGDGNKVILDSHPTVQTWVPKFQLQVLSLSSTTETDYLPFPNFLIYQYKLTSLDLTSCKLKREFPKWLLENNTKMTDLILRNCSFTGTFQLPSRPLLNMWRIDVSDNAITGQISNNISSIFPNLQFLNMSTNVIHGSIPNEFGQMNSLDTLDLSHNRLSGEIPKNISGVRSLLRFLKLSENKLDGPLFPILSTLNNLEQLYLDGNSLSGSIPSSFSSTTLLALDISNNDIVGKLPSKMGNLSKLVELSMSNNHLEGSTPAEFVEVESLTYLDISQNNLIGSVPSFINSSIRFIHMSNNRLSGLSKRMFSESSSTVVLDLRYNEINTSIHDMIQDLSYTGLYILLFKGNYFMGQIPKQLCQLIDLTILDLSYNNFSGPIPGCLGKIPFDNENTRKLQLIFGGFHDRGLYALPWVQEKADFTTKKVSLTYVGSILDQMTGIDFSYNKLNGNIPSELGNLTNIRALNLSHNFLTGKIPTTFSNLAQIESLDISFNDLSGNIPPQLSKLTSLAVFSVAHNNLSGATPDRNLGQFMTFDESSYEGNPFLCGPPLPRNCTAHIEQPSVDGDNNDTWVDMYVFYVSFVVSYTVVLLAIAATLYINPQWRRAWFYYIELIITNCYYFIEDNLHKFLNIY